LILSPLVDFLHRFREREKENAAQITKAATGPIRLAVGTDEPATEAQTRMGEQAIPR